jgi:predicted outer membrane repeat protein
MKKTTILSTILLLLCFYSVKVDAATLYVPSVYTTIQDAVDAALNGDIVLIADGVYTGDGNKNIDFSGKSITVQSDNGPLNCIIDCEGDGRGFSSISTDSVISGFTIKNGYSSRGGAINCGYNNSTIDNCILINNIATLLGGAIYSQGDIILTDCIIDGNTAGEGGGVYFFDASPMITNCWITNNYTSGNLAYKNRGGHLLFLFRFGTCHYQLCHRR